MKEEQKVSENSINTTKKSHRRILLFLLIFVLVTGLILLWRLGTLTPAGTPEDTIVISPNQNIVAALSVSGRLLNSDGTPTAGLAMELHSKIQTATTDENGFFLFAAAEEGKHVLLTKDAEGKEMQRMTFVLTSNDTEAVSVEADGAFMQLSIPKETLVLEFDLIAGTGNNAASIILQGATAILKDGSVSSSFGKRTAPQGGGIVTFQGTQVMQDGTVRTMSGGVVLPNGSYVSPQGKVFADAAQKVEADLMKGYEMDEAGRKLSTPNGSEIYLADKKTKLANGATVENERVRLPDGKIIADAKGTMITRDAVVPLEKAETEQSKKTTVDNRKTANVIPSRNNSSQTAAGGTTSRTTKPSKTDTQIPQESEKPEETVTPKDPEQPTEEEQKEQKQEKKEQKTGSGGGSGRGGGESPSKQSYLNVLDELTNQNWTQLSTIDIFKDVDKLFPGCTGAYKFCIQNGISGSAFFRMTIEEAEDTNVPGRIPLEYRLKETEGGYVAGDANTWLKANDEGLTAMNVTLAKSGSIRYTLEWRWPRERGTDAASTAGYDAEDTALGTSENREHKINVRIYAEEVN